MKKYIYLLSILIGTTACNKKIAKDISTDVQSESLIYPSVETMEYNQTKLEAQDEEVLDPNYFPPPVIQTFEELDNWLEYNDNLILAHFKVGNTKPFFALDEGLIQRLVDLINERERLTFKLIGHTNSVGSAARNMELSVKRSRAVMEIMINKYGLQLSKLGAFGEGESNPLNDNSTLEKRKANSRVELRMLR